MSILNVDKIQPIGGGSTITVDATDIQATSATITASKFVGSGDLSVTGVSTFTGNIDANGDLDVAGVSTFTGNIDANGDLDVDGHTNLDNVSISGISSTGNIYITTGGDGRKLSFAGDGSSHYIKMDHTLNGPIINGYGGIAFETNGTNERLRITSDGKVGMGVPSTSPGSTCNPDGNQLLIRGPSTFQTNKGHIMLTGDSATVGQGPQIVFSESGSGSNAAGAYIGHVRQGGNSIGDLVFGTRETAGDANTVPTERLRIDSGGRVSIGNNPTVHTSTLFHVEDTGELNVKFEGNTSTLGARLTLQNNNTTANSYSQYSFNDAGGQATSAIQGINTDQTNNYGELAFLTRNAQGSPPAERMRITKDGAIQNYYNSSLPVTDSRPILQLGYSVIGDDSSGYNAVTCNAYPVNGNSTWHYIGSSSLGASRYHIGFGDHKWFTAAAGTRGNDITWSERLRIASDGRFGFGTNSPSAYALATFNSGNGIQLQGDTQTRILMRDSGGGTNQKMMDIMCDAGSTYFRTIADNYTTATQRAVFRSDGNFAVGYRVGTNGVSTNQPVAFHSARVTPDTASSTLSNGVRCNLYVGSNSGWQAGDGGVIGMGGSRSGGAGEEAMWAYIKGSRQSSNGWEYAGKMELGTAEWGTYNTTKAVTIYADNQFSLHGDDNTMMTFNIGGALRLLIEHTGGGNMRLRNHSSGSVTYSTSSDYRLKENESAISNALSTVKALKPYQFTWKHDNKLGQGFFAHEAQAVLPDIGVVSGTKDEVQAEDDTKHDGQWKKDDPIYQSVDYSKLVPLLTAALQEETAKREALEARVAALEGS